MGQRSAWWKVAMMMLTPKPWNFQAEKGYTFIHPFDDEFVIAGQATIGLELLESLPDLEGDVWIGGGGLILVLPMSSNH